MGRYRKIDSRCQNDEKIRKLSDDAELIWYRLLTHPGMTSLGAMRHTVAGLAAEKGWSIARMRKVFAEFPASMVQVDEAAACIWMPNFLRYNEPENPNVVTGWRGALDLIPECDLRSQCLATAARICVELDAELERERQRTGKPKKRTLCGAFSDAFAGELHRLTLPEGFPKPLATPEPEQEPEQEPPQEGGGASPSAIAEEPPEFERDFWPLYPNHDGKVDAERAWEKLAPTPELWAAMRPSLEKQRASPRWQKDGGAYVPLAVNWLRGRRWEDEGQLALVERKPPRRITYRCRKCHQPHVQVDDAPRVCTGTWDA